MVITKEKIGAHNSFVPHIRGDVFRGNEDKQFAFFSLTSDQVINYEQDSIEQAYLKLRANVYIDQKKFLERDIRRFDGTEIDENDERSTHLVIAENILGSAAVFACMRIIEKTNTNPKILPVEEFFSDAFLGQEAPINSVEISRFIVRNDDREKIILAKKKLVSGALARTFEQNLGPVFAVVETNLERELRMMRIPTRRLCDPKLVSEYNTENLGIEMDKFTTLNRMGEEAVSLVNIIPGSEPVFFNK